MGGSVVSNEAYKAYRANKIESARLFQDFVVDVCWQKGLAIVQFSSKAYQFTAGESRTGAEIKHDEIYGTSNRLWIEVAEKAQPRPGPYAPSGIYRDDNSWLYIIGDYNVFFIFFKKQLQGLHRSGRYRDNENKTRTSVGFFLPHDDAMKYAGLVVYPMAGDEVARVVGDIQSLGRELHNLVLEDGKQLALFSKETS
jgi:hypothetical protein